MANLKSVFNFFLTEEVVVVPNTPFSKGGTTTNFDSFKEAILPSSKIENQSFEVQGQVYADIAKWCADYASYAYGKGNIANYDKALSLRRSYEGLSRTSFKLHTLEVIKNQGTLF